MERLLIAAVLVALSAPAAAQEAAPPKPTIEQQTLLRCSATFALVAAEQASGDQVALAYPPLATRGREYFVRVAAKLMDELGASREQVAAMLEVEVGRVQAERAQADDPAVLTDRIMQTCLVSLVASGL